MPKQIVGGRYELARRILTGDSARGIPELWSAQDAGDLFYVKRWNRRRDDQSDIRALWNREVRGLTRLQGYPGARELFVRLQDLGVDDSYYYAVLDGGRRMLLSQILDKRQNHAWLLNLAEVGRRRPIWEGLLRIAEALSILHSEGTLHRSLSSFAVFVGPEGQGDFRLSGFEWSLRVSGQDGAAAVVNGRTALPAPELERAPEYSIATDWYDFGLLAAELFGVSVRTIKRRASLLESINRLSNLRDSERGLILQLIELDDEQRLSSAETILGRIRDIIRDLNLVTVSSGRSLVLAVRLGADREISREIERVSHGTARSDSPEQQRDWMEQDLRGDVRLIARTNPYPHFVVRGTKFEYRVRQWAVDGLSTWDVGFCEALEPMPRSTPDDQVFGLGQRRLEIALYPRVRRALQTVRDRSIAWDRIFPFRKERVQLEPHLRNVHDFFRVTQQLDTVITAAQICPVRVISTERSETETEVTVTPHEEATRNDLARQLKLSSPSEQLRDWFGLGVEEIICDDDSEPADDEYNFLTRPTIASDSGTSANWRFIEATQHPSGPRYRFRCLQSVPRPQGILYLARSYGGTIAQIRRRHKAIEDMRSHETLLQLLADPIAVSKVRGDELPASRVDIPLDDSKLDALERLWKTQPSFATQGPPGTGKTTLIRAFADRLFGDDPGAQILITAHSHHTVDDVRTKLASLFTAFPEAERPIILRLGARQDTDHDIGPVTKQILSQLQKSELLLRSEDFLRQRLDAALQSKAGNAEADIDLRTMELLVQDAANLTFATSNSADLAELTGRGRRFDWSIIEEAGKAHGFDMTIALQESHRLFLIGDHFQLPPFNAKFFRELLGDPLRVRKAIQTGVQFAPGLVDPSLVEDEEGRDPFEDRCNIWRRMVNLFEVIFERSSEGGGAQVKPAATLTDQHRMHPDIADVVGHVFYPDGDGGTILKSPPETHNRFSGLPPVDIVAGSWLPGHRVVWCDVDWIQKTEYSIGEVEGLFVSPAEVKCVVDILDQLRPRDDRSCEIQILSPYNDQLDEIRSAVAAERRMGRLTHMFNEPFNLMVGKRLGATVDEFQGSEADVVIVSLVRNNALVPWKSIGFLKEPNRMNVLMSRARQKLIIVGSWDFFDTRCNAQTSTDDEYSYIGRMMNFLKGAEKAGKVARVRGAK